MSAASPTVHRSPRRGENRLQALLEAAAVLFAERGFRDTTMREIATASDMLAGSIYYHFASKEALLVAVYEEGVERLRGRIDAADPGPDSDAWDRLQAIMVAHLSTILDGSAFARVLLRVLPDEVPTARDALVALRDEYECRVSGAIEALPLAAGVDRRLLRLFLLGAANHTQLWRHEAGLAPATIASHLVHMFRHQCEQPHPRPEHGQ